MEGKPARKYTSDILDELFSIKPVDELHTKKMLLAVKIDEGIKDKKLSKKQFAKLMKVQPSVVSKWISGNQNFTINTLFEIERVLKIKLINT